MSSKKLVISGLSANAHEQFAELAEAVRAQVEPEVRRKIDASVLGRFAITSLLNCYRGSPDKLARLLGFEAKNHE